MPDPIANPTAARTTPNVDFAAQLANGLGLSEDATQQIKDVAALLGSRSVNVSAPAAPDRGEAGNVNGATGVPVLDNPDDATAKEVDLEKLIAYLQLENSKEQAESAKSRIDAFKGQLENQFKDRMAKMDKSLKDMDEAAKSRTANKVFGWLLTGLAILGAVIACVATGGIAVGAVVGAGIALGAQIMNETGVMDKIVGGLSDLLQKAGCSKMAAQILAQVIVTLVIVAASCGAGLAGAGAATAGNATNALAKAIQASGEIISKGLKIGTGVLGAISTVSGGVGAYLGYKSGMSQADLTETEKYLKMIQQQLDEAEEELQQILQQIQSLVGQIAELLSSETNTIDEIASQLGQMA